MIEVGAKFGKLTVIQILENPITGRTRYLCQCQCGDFRIVSEVAARTGRVTSCGCVKTSPGYVEKGRLYSCWRDMKGRCQNPRNTSYYYYGGRGIKVCPEWQTYAVFHEWAMANGYADHLTLDRIDFNGDYSPENCRWATMKEQNRNKRGCHMIGGKCLAQWAEELGTSASTIRCRIKSGWTIHDAITTPVKKRQKGSSKILTAIS